MLLVGHDGDATMAHLIQQEGNVWAQATVVALVDARGDLGSAPSTRRRPTTVARRSLPQSGRSSAR
jgi:hypothetical protein